MASKRSAGPYCMVIQHWKYSAKVTSSPANQTLNDDLKNQEKEFWMLQKHHHRWRWPSMWSHGWWLKEVWRKWALCKLLSVCVWVRGRVAGTIQLPAGQCPVADPSVSTLIRQWQATASWTPCAPMHIQTLSDGSKVDYLGYVYTIPFENASFSLYFGLLFSLRLFLSFLRCSCNWIHFA